MWLAAKLIPHVSYGEKAGCMRLESWDTRIRLSKIQEGGTRRYDFKLTLQYHKKCERFPY